jgi:DNA-binding transcriptional ArsR family regulator
MADKLSKIFAALGDPIRRDIVVRLTEADATVGQLAASYDVSLQAVSKHLKVLEDAGLVTRSREAQKRPVHLQAEVFDVMTKWIERYRRQAERRYQRLDAVLVEMTDRPDATDRNAKEKHHEHRIRGSADRGGSGRPGHSHHPRLPRHAGATDEGAHRP